jgi:hypothetical protein
MPRFRCLECKTRLPCTESDRDRIGDLCHVCGSLLEPVGDLGEIVGYSVIGHVAAHATAAHRARAR